MWVAVDGCRAACRGRNVTQHIDLSFVGRVRVHDGPVGTRRQGGGAGCRDGGRGDGSGAEYKVAGKFTLFLRWDVAAVVCFWRGGAAGRGEGVAFERPHAWAAEASERAGRSVPPKRSPGRLHFC